MAMALIPPAVLVVCGKWRWNDIGFAPFHFSNRKLAWCFIPFLVVLIPPALNGFYIKSTDYILGNLFLYSFVGIAEEVYFRGIIPRFLRKQFSAMQMVMISSFIFGLGHIATALIGSGIFEIVLTILNALIFGWLAIEMTMLASSIIPATLFHFLFDFETKIAFMSGRELLIAECIRGVLMFAMASWFAIVIHKQENDKN